MGMTTLEKSYFNSFREVTKAISSTLDLQQVLDLVVAKMAEVMKLKACAIRLLDSKQRTLELLASQGLSDAYIKKGAVDADRSIAEAMEGKVVVINDASADPRAQYQKEAVAEGIASIVSVPLQVRGRIIGVLRLYSATPREFSPDELEFAEALAEMGAIAIENAKMYERIKKDYESVMTDIYNFVGYRRSI
jgi:GAF domain-containing protein